VSDQAHTRSRRTATGSKPSIYDVAALAGVSHQTVSRVVNGHPNIRATTREKVLAAMAEIDYTPSSIARALATNRSRRIGVIVDSPRVRARQHDARHRAGRT
jgi:DNA-binding LacI/PurR family transcriptional regulator